MKLLAVLTLMVGTGAGCSLLTDGGITDPCIERLRPYAMNVEMSASADTVPLVDWSPAECGAAYLEVWRWRPGQTCSGEGGFGYEICWPNSVRLWHLRADGPIIHPPIRYGVSPDSSWVLQPPREVRVGDTLMVVLQYPGRDPDYADPQASLFLIVGQGVIRR